MISTVAMDKIIAITEKNLQMQSEFLRALMELRSRFDTTDRDHRDIQEAVKTTIATGSEIISRMTAASNEQILASLEKDRETTTDLYTEFCTMCLKISTIADSLTESDRWSKRFISIVTVLLILIQSVSVYMMNSKENETEKMRTQITEMIDTLKDSVDSKQK